ncbi:hypothetical protein [Marinomonas sp. TW1]|uniref:hypothetical protein n=1 Tax=Marinomonas sp. TW1 TaxID=1561203 RepID=UPI000A77ABE4|nr:hypothetical protein [Marinomonas sp. TW1]
MDTIHTVGIDLAKSVFQICAFNQAGKNCLIIMLRRNQLLRFLSNIEPCLIGIIGDYS